MKLPMVLPWLAHRAGVSDSRAEALWQQATRQAELMTGERSSSCYWGAALQILLDLLEQERLTTYPLFAWPWLLMRGSVAALVLAGQVLAGADSLRAPAARLSSSRHPADGDEDRGRRAPGLDRLLEDPTCRRVNG
jgi:hypothetical protein